MTFSRRVIQELQAQLDLSVPDEVSGKCAAFLDLVEKWNKKTSLVAKMTTPQLAEVLFADAWTLAENDLIEEGSLVDIGAGVGAPALPLALSFPNLTVSLVEPRRRRVSFLRTAVGTLGLHSRVEVLEANSDQVDGHWDQAMSRATFEPAEWLSVGRSFSDRLLVLSSGPVAEDHGWELEKEILYEIPSTKNPRWAGRFRR